MFKKWFGFGKKEDIESTMDQTPETEGAEAETPETSDSEQEGISEAVSEEESLEETPEEEPLIEEPESEVENSQEAVSEMTLVEETQEPIDSKEEFPLNEAVAETSFEVEDAENGGFFKRLMTGLDKTRKGIVDRIDQAINQYGDIDEALFDEIEEILITADVGMETTLKLVEDLREELKVRKVKDTEGVHQALAAVMERLMTEGVSSRLEDRTPTLYLVIGVNGAGKTTSIGKIAYQKKKEGRKILLAAADTFRAAAIDQLKVWAERAAVPLIAHQEGSDPAAVVFDAIQAAKSRGVDLLICDTAGRLHNKKNLMNELEKIHRIIDREWPEVHKEVLLVLDATTGQNAVQQARLFSEVADINGIVLTKLDGTAKGGVVLSIQSELKIPVKLIGVGEGMTDLQPFIASDFVHALMKMPQ